MFLSNFLAKLKAYYVAELLMFITIIYLLASFVHISLDPAHWHIITRIIFAVLVLLLILLINLISDKKARK